MEERREHQRYKLIEQTCIIHHNKTVGTIIDISAGGLSCVCLDQGECTNGIATTINIYCKKHDTRAEAIKMKVLSTEMMPGQFLEDLGLRRCRARFCNLDTDQKSQLANIIVDSSLG